MVLIVVKNRAKRKTRKILTIFCLRMRIMMTIATSIGLFCECVDHDGLVFSCLFFIDQLGKELQPKYKTMIFILLPMFHNL